MIILLAGVTLALACARECGGYPEEELCLCYVGMTRAKECLYLFGSRAERVNGHFERVSPSRYLADIPTSVTRMF